VTAIELMRDVGKHFPVPYMLAKDSVASRLETGISYTEFSYMVLQAFDFLELNRRFGCELQTGGSDQWGNITAGSDLIRRTGNGKAYGLTCPLVTDADGSKFGKTEAGALWLSAERTTPYELYQYWINTDDRTVVSYLKIFTFLGPDDIHQLEEAVASDPGAREAQRTLAREATTVVHGADAARKAERISRALFYGEVRELAEDELQLAFHDVPTHAMEGAEQGLVDLLVVAGVSSSKRQARQDISAGAVYLNGERCTEESHIVRRADGLHGRYTVIRRGTNRYFLVQ
jgi:tyrosyl-tRNA synthetase